MLVTFAYAKLVRSNQQTFTPGTAITTTLRLDQGDIQPLGAAGTAAPSTVIFDRSPRGNQYYLSKPFSAVYAAITAATSDAAPINII